MRSLLLTITWAGRTWRLAQRHLDVTDALGRSLHYHAGLTGVDVEDRLTMLEVGAAQTIQVEALLPADVARLVDRGHQLQGATAELAWYSGDYDGRDVILLGQVRDPEYRPSVGLVKLTLDPTGGTDSALWPPEDAVISDDTQAIYDPAVEGRSYPWIIGSPGSHRRSGVYAGAAGSPAYALDDATGIYEDVLLAGHVCAGDYHPATGTASMVLRDETAGVEDTLTGTGTWLGRTGVGTGHDLMGRWCLVARVSAAAGHAPLVHAAWAPGHELTARWYPGLSAGIGLHGSSDTPAELACDVLRWALGLSSVRVDWRRTEAAAHLLRLYRLAGYWDQRCSPLQWVQDQIIPITPVSLVPGPQGIYPVVWRWWAGIESASHWWEVGRSCRYVAGPSSSIDYWDRPQEVAVSYARSCASGSTSRNSRIARALTPDARGTYQTTTARRTALDAVSSDARQIDADLCWDPLTAGLTARSRLLLWSELAPSATVRVPASLRVELGDVVALTWPQVTGTSPRAALVTSRVRRGVAADVTLRVSIGQRYR